MMKFGFNSTELDTVAQFLETALNVRLVLHESSFRGGDYYRAETPLVEVILQTNRDLLDNEPFEAAWPKEKVILYVSTPEDDPGRGFAKALQTVVQHSGATDISESSPIP